MRGGGGRGYGRFDEEANPLRKTSFAEFFSVMAPYFWPGGALPRVRALACFTALLLSKIANIVAPLMMGQATQDMLNLPPTVPVGPLVA